MATDLESIAEQLEVPPTTIEEAEAQLDLITLAKKQLNIEKDYVMDQQRQEREQYSTQTSKNDGLGSGLVRLISPTAADTLEGLGGTLDDYQRRGLAKDLEPLEARRALIEQGLLALDQRALELEYWITQQEYFPPEEGETVPPPPRTRIEDQLIVVPPGQPTSMEEAEWQLEMVELRQKELNIEKRKIAEAQRLAREANTSKDRKGATRGKGPIALITPKAADVLEETQDSMNDLRERSMARDLEALEDQRMAIEKEISQLELQELELETWIEKEEERLKAEEKAQKESVAEAEEAEVEEDASSSSSSAQAEAEQAKVEAEKAKAEAELAKAEAEKAKAEAEIAKAEAAKAQAEAEKAKAEAEAARAATATDAATQ